MFDNESISDWPALLTGTIIPHIQAISQYNDPHIRETQYIETLKWIGKSNTGLNKFVFCENSDASLDIFYPLTDYFKKHNQQIEIHKVPVPQISCFPGKGWGEGIILAWALKHSPILLQSDSFIKMTGRYQIRNIRRINSLINRGLEREPHIQFICQNFSLYQGKPHINTAFFWSRCDFFRRYLSDAYTDVNDAEGIYLEHVLAARLMNLRDRYAIRILPLPLLIKGIMGWNGKPVLSTHARIKSEVQQMLEPLPTLQLF
jgi:hypothetical protein